jgi:Thioredoxin
MSEERPLLVLLGADWCTWCRKLEVDLQETDAETILKAWVVVKIDVDEQPELAESMQARGLPALRVLDFGRNVVAKHEGYLPTAELQSWLDEQYAVANPAVQAVLFGTEQPSASDLKQLIDLLADRSPKTRQAAQQRLIPHRSLSASAVVEIFKTGRLVQQLAAMQILSAWKAPIESLDPWTPSTVTDERLSLLGDWLESIPSEDAAREVEKEAPNEIEATRLREP